MCTAKYRANVKMWQILLLFSLFFLTNSLSAQVYTINACPGENASNTINISWAADTTHSHSFVLYTKLSDTKLKNIKRVYPQMYLCRAFDSIYSKTADNKDFYERVIFHKCNASLTGLKSDTDYLYWVVPSEEYLQNNPLTLKDARRFKTAGAKEWSACVISDFHTYTPLPKRQEAATKMMEVIEKYDDGIDWILHLGDITAWGGSYSFWKNLYENKFFRNYMWAGVNGNHDNMTRTNFLSNEFFRNVNFYPRNGYEGEEGVVYFFKYNDVLFIMLNNEGLRTDSQLQKAQEWVRKVVNENKASYIVVCEHYQWFFGNNGKFSEYSRWSKLFDELGVDLALAGNNHIYARTNALYNGKESDGTKGTLYLQTPPSDNERGRKMDEKLSANEDIIKYRWTEGPKTVGALYMKVNKKSIKLLLLNRFGEVLDSAEVLRKK